MTSETVIHPAAAGLDADAIEDAWLALVQAGERHEYGGAVALIARHGRIALYRATGWAVREPAEERAPMGEDTIFDLASLTKVVATTPSVLHLVVRGAFTLDTPARDLLPIFAAQDVSAEITVRRLLTHSAGFPAWLPVFMRERGRDAYLRAFAREPLAYAPGERVTYSDPSFITLGEIVREVSGCTVADYAREHVFAPLGMTDTLFMPTAARRLRVAATEVGNAFEAAKVDAPEPADGPWRSGLIRGEVHDGNAWYGFGGVAGHAGLFGTAIDLSRYARMWLGGGAVGDVRILPEELVAEATREQIAHEGERRGLGWRLAPGDVAGEEDSALGVGPRGYGHTGFTGTSIWIDPDAGMVIVLLTNRVHPIVTMDYMGTRARFTRQVMEAVR